MKQEQLCDGNGPFRLNAGALIIRNLGGPSEILLGERHDTPGYWQWPQGGIERGEDARAAVMREVYEETGLNQLKIMAQLPNTYRYRFPVSLARKFNPFIGQEQTYFLLHAADDVSLDMRAATTPEFKHLRWLDFTDLSIDTVWFKQGVYQQVIQDAREMLSQLSPSFD